MSTPTNTGHTEFLHLISRNLLIRASRPSSPSHQHCPSKTRRVDVCKTRGSCIATGICPTSKSEGRQGTTRRWHNFHKFHFTRKNLDHNKKKSKLVETMVAIKSFASLISAVIISSASGFSTSISSSDVLSSQRQNPIKNNKQTRLNAFALEGALASVDSFYQTQPYLAAFLTCATKASAADWVAQSQQEDKNVRRNLAFILYGGFYQGCVQTFIYTVVFPTLFPDPSAQTILSQVAIDLLFLGPLICMPTVYTMKALLAGEEGMTAGIEKYVDHVQNKGILTKYWSIWGPVQTLNFGLVPQHLQVVFVACVSFFWICLLSTVSAEESNEEQAIEAATSTNNALPPALLPQVAVPLTLYSDGFTAAAAAQTSPFHIHDNKQNRQYATSLSARRRPSSS